MFISSLKPFHTDTKFKPKNYAFSGISPAKILYQNLKCDTVSFGAKDKTEKQVFPDKLKQNNKIQKEAEDKKNAVNYGKLREMCEQIFTNPLKFVKYFEVNGKGWYICQDKKENYIELGINYPTEGNHRSWQVEKIYIYKNDKLAEYKEGYSDFNGIEKTAKIYKFENDKLIEYQKDVRKYKDGTIKTAKNYKFNNGELIDY